MRRVAQVLGDLLLSLVGLAAIAVGILILYLHGSAVTATVDIVVGVLFLIALQGDARSRGRR